MVLVRSERLSAPVETRQSPLDLERGYCIALEFFDTINAPIKSDISSRKQVKTFNLQDRSQLSVERPLMEGTNFSRRPSPADHIVITFSRNNDIKELRYNPQGLLSVVWQTKEGTTVGEYIEDMQTDDERESFKKKGEIFARLAAKRYFFPFASAEIGVDREDQLLPTGDDYYYRSSYLVGPPPDLGKIHEPIYDR